MINRAHFIVFGTWALLGAFAVVTVVILVCFDGQFSSSSSSYGRTRGVGNEKEEEEAFQNEDVPTWQSELQGSELIGSRRILNAGGRNIVFDAVGRVDGQAGDACKIAGRKLPHEWRPTEEPGVCVLSMSSNVVRNMCGKENGLLYHPRFVKDVGIDPVARNCLVRFKEAVVTASKPDRELTQYMNDIDIIGILRKLVVRRDELLERVADLSDQLKKSEALIKRHEKRITELRATKDEFEGRVADLNDRLKTQDTMAEEYKRTIAELRATEDKLRKLLRESKQKKKERQGSSSSSSLPISKNMRCGPRHGTRCKGSGCCSKFGWCGGGDAHCKKHKRNDNKYDGPDRKSAASSLPISDDMRCGPDRGTRCKGSGCCSTFGWCGSGDSHCKKHKRDDDKYDGPDANK